MQKGCKRRSPNSRCGKLGECFSQQYTVPSSLTTRTLTNKETRYCKFELSTGLRLPLTNRIDTFSARRAMNFSNSLSTAGFLASCAEWEDVGQLYKWPNFRLARALRRRSRREEDYYPHVYVSGFLVVGIPKCLQLMNTYDCMVPSSVQHTTLWARPRPKFQSYVETRPEVWSASWKGLLCTAINLLTTETYPFVRSGLDKICGVWNAPCMWPIPRSCRTSSQDPYWPVVHEGVDSASCWRLDRVGSDVARPRRGAIFPPRNRHG